MEIPRLNDMCMFNITKHIWHVHDPMESLITYFRIKGRGYHPWDLTQKIPFVQQLNSIIEQISRFTHIPQQLRTNISMAYLMFVMDIMEWFTTLQQGLYYDDLMYVMEKTVFTDKGKVDRPCTIVRVLFDTYGNIDIRNDFIKHCCIMTPTIVDAYVKRNKYITNKILIQKIKKKVAKMQLKGTEESEPYKMKLSVDGVVEMLQLFHISLKDSEKTKWLSEVTAHLMQSKNSYFTDKIIYIYHHIDNGTWLKILQKDYLTIITEFFHCGPSEYCLLFYKQIIKSKPDTNIHILKTLMHEINNLRYSFCYDAFKEFQKDIFVKIWDSTPDNVKTSFIKTPQFYEHLAHTFCFFHNYDIICTFLKDKIISEKERKDLINFLILRHKENEFCKYESHLCRLYNDFHIESPNYDETALKIFFIQGSQRLYCLKRIDNIFEDKEQMIAFKEKFSKDHKFVIEVISNFNPADSCISDVIEFLYWFYPNQQDATKFVKEHLLRTDLNIDIYCDYLRYNGWMNLRKKNCFNMLFNNESVQLACELRDIINDPNFFKRSLNKILMKGDYNSLKYYLKNIYDDIEINVIVESYLLSESGVKDVLDKFIHTECASERLDFIYKAKETIKDILKFKKYWLKNFDLLEPFCLYMSENSKLIYQKHFKLPEENDMLPYESLEQFKTIIDARYTIFMSLMKKKVSRVLVDELIYSPSIISLSHIAARLSEDLDISLTLMTIKD